ncbi:MAG: hypothetical protein LDLANPLL_00412 [Turneriella sp.]|nr:hypothetical protein [Turneriella sp.]
MIWRFIFAIVVTAWVLWQIPFSRTQEIFLPEFVAFSSFEDNADVPSENPILTFYRKVDKGQYRTFGVNASGAIIRSVVVPGLKIKKPDETIIPLDGKEGFITGPENGAYFIWYPQLGSQVYVFNEKGAFLWEKEESHYLHALPYGRYILASAGDGSRMLFVNPDFKIHADFQGVLFNHYILDDNPELKSAQVCLSTLDGDLIVAHLDKKIYFRKHLGYALKSLQCDFEKATFAAIVEERVKKKETATSGLAKDFLLTMEFTLENEDTKTTVEKMTEVKAKVKTIAKRELPVLTQTASPLVIAGENICFLQTDGEFPVVYYSVNKSSPLQKAPLSLKVTQALVADTWRSQSILVRNEPLCLFTHRLGQFALVNRRGLLSERNGILSERSLKKNANIFLQTHNGILTLR